MKKNQLGNSSLYVSEIGFGCMSLGDNHEANEALIHKAIDNGINFFDTADLYQFGFNEESVGKAIKGKREDIILASKGGNEWGEEIDGWRWNPSKQHLKSAVKNSLQRLNTDYLDLYQLHGGTIDDPIDETIETFEELVQEGVIRYYGISSIRPNVIKTFLEKSNIISVMMQYSLLDRRPEEWFDLLDRHNVSVIARGPMAKGLLTSNYKQKLTEKGFLSYSESELTKLIPKIQSIAEEHGYTVEELAIRYTVKNSTIATAIPGASKLNQLEANIAAANSSPLDESIMRQINEVLKYDTYDKHRN
ncbi:aldo/keto reductase [Bacillus shivajii]|uniref:aldo/keto reductase n=1 Tax=Bacillus shivajii TaxID=1983719 RepID=UPI001CF948F0|nr:aldo/keto reductase [Bacillus shivajii]UCZ54685.1 aldo/keto reductase [Bacillus shivajii]